MTGYGCSGWQHPSDVATCHAAQSVYAAMALLFGSGMCCYLGQILSGPADGMHRPVLQVVA